MNIVKVMTSPNAGTRKINLPVVGKIDLVEGGFSCSEEDFEALKALQTGFSFSKVYSLADVAPAPDVAPPVVAPVAPPVADETSDPVLDDTVTALDYSTLKVRELDEIISEISAKNLCTKEEIDEIMTKNKPEKIAFILEKL
jgi:hypothetical protein